MENVKKITLINKGKLSASINANENVQVVYVQFYEFQKLFVFMQLTLRRKILNILSLQIIFSCPFQTTPEELFDFCHLTVSS